jgi:hypothetical protein
MLKYLSLTVLSTVLFFSYALGATGCKTGNYIYTVQNGTYDSGGTIPKFTATDRITLRDYDQDPRCGILRSTAEGYAKVTSPSNPNSRCTSDSSLGDIGTLISYNPSDSNCVALPLDDYVPSIIGSIGIVGFIIIRKKHSHIL